MIEKKCKLSHCQLIISAVVAGIKLQIVRIQSCEETDHFGGCTVLQFKLEVIRQDQTPGECLAAAIEQKNMLRKHVLCAARLAAQQAQQRQK